MTAQIFIAIFGVTAVALSQSKLKARRRWACIFGLIGQPFWFYAAWQGQQWGIFVLSFIYTASWLHGLWNYWLAPSTSSSNDKDAIESKPKLDDGWKSRLLDGSPLELDNLGCGIHPALPSFDESVNGKQFFSLFGLELKAATAQSEIKADADDSVICHSFAKDGANYNAWSPTKPCGDGWSLVAIFNTENGLTAWWLREKPVVAQAKQGGSDAN